MGALGDQMYTYFFYGCVCFVLLEMTLVQSPLMFLGLGLVGIVCTCGLCVYGGLELLGLALLAAYASVFLFLSVIAVCLGQAWEVGGWTRWGGLVVPVCSGLLGGLLAHVWDAEPMHNG
jgi:hypothetical protein